MLAREDNIQSAHLSTRTSIYIEPVLPLAEPDVSKMQYGFQIVHSGKPTIEGKLTRPDLVEIKNAIDNLLESTRF